VAQGRGAEAQSNPVLQGVNMPVVEVDTFAGIDVSAHELSVALRRGQGHDKPAMAKFPNHPSGHKALVVYLLRVADESGSAWRPVGITAWIWR
jgi:hypothetical protein